MSESKLRELSMEFSVDIIELVKHLKSDHESIIIFSLAACSQEVVKGSIIRQADIGMAQLDIVPQKLFEFAEIGDVVVVTAGEFQAELPLVDVIITEEGKLQLFFDSNEHSLSICAYNQNFCETYNVSPDAKVKITKK